ncbi:terpene cyclase/mutase family protein [Streptomyces sp. DSM 44915]|uniref:Terpene cyclase/mutase family protein n=1 Tax=Streptomyces chisholmiae TaxID=3075540 RepID=A0ABU2JNB9_9ACTN|nr:prenyltransferase/squalene oxidase repeat-containing protein [Streptomyces sp. DSM 44915]MDT0266472.1 terpene cyclase/mutase family protein [Streptomyces sp. DSM 44915]
MTQTSVDQPTRLRRGRPWRGALALAGSAVLTGTLLVPGGARADAPPELASPAEAAVAWSVAQLTDGTHASADHGLTADLVLAFAATGTAGDAAERATDWLAANAADYARRGGPDAVNAGGTAKLALVASVQHRDPGDFGGLDLTGLLLERLNADGRFTDAAPTGDMSNQFSQSLAVLALNREGELPDSAVEFLASTRCDSGGFPLSLSRRPDRCNPDTDSTGMAVQALVDAGRTADAEPALDWLEGQQQANGGFGYNATSAPNSNSTALAVQALLAGGRTEAAASGVSWLRGLQAGCAAPAADRGGVGYMDPEIDGMALRATAQVIPALAGKPLGEIDGAGADPTPGVIDCAPDDGTGGGTQGTSDGGDQGADGGASDAGAANGGTDGGTDGGADAGQANGGADGGTSDAGTDGGLAGGASDGDGTEPPGGDPAEPGATLGTTTGGSDGGLDGGVSGDDSGLTAGGTDRDGNLASTGSSVLPLLGWAAALLAAGGGAWALAHRHRRRTAAH